MPSCRVCRFDRVQLPLFPESHPRGVWSGQLASGRRLVQQQQRGGAEVRHAERERCLGMHQFTWSAAQHEHTSPFSVQPNVNDELNLCQKKKTLPMVRLSAHLPVLKLCLPSRPVNIVYLCDTKILLNETYNPVSVLIINISSSGSRNWTSQAKLPSCFCSFYFEILSAVSGFNPQSEKKKAFVLLCFLLIMTHVTSCRGSAQDPTRPAPCQFHH